MRPIIIGVAGGSGSGKTTIVNLIMENLNEDDVVIIRHDDYYKDQSDMEMEERTKVNYDHPFSLDNNLLRNDLLKLVNDESIEKPIYDFTIHNRMKEVEIVKPAKVIVVEGILIFEDAGLRDLMDIKVYVEADPDLRFIRRLERDVKERARSMDSVINQYLSTVKPMHYQFVSPSKRHADIIIPNHYKHSVATDVMITKIKSIISA
ncbi:uridine kinase [Mycoplasmatota bacterium]|nr:uridine kinase [Mycoplasmatota bacterium]